MIKRDGRKNHQEEAIKKLHKIFEEAIEKSKRVLTEVGDFLKEMLLCDDILTLLHVPSSIVEDFEYQEMRNWIIFREYANQLEFNIQAFQILVDRIEDAERGEHWRINSRRRSREILQQKQFQQQRTYRNLMKKRFVKLNILLT